MPNVSFLPTEFTYIASNAVNSNFSSYSSLRIGRTFGANTCIQYNSLLRFDLNFQKCNSEMVEQAFLYIPLSRIRANTFLRERLLTVSTFDSGVPFSALTWNTMPPCNELLTHRITNSEIREHWIVINITNQVIRWLCNYDCSANIMISTLTSGLSAIIPRPYYGCSPYIEITYFNDLSSQNENNQLNPALKSSDFLYLEAINHKLEIIEQKQKFPFDVAIPTTGRNITFNRQENAIIIRKKGFYHCSWIFNIQGTGDLNFIEVGFIQNGKENVHSGTVFIQTPGQITHQFVLLVDTVPAKFTVCNASVALLQLGNREEQGSLIIQKL
ncbi:MAG: DNRLRE domain-containing protein [bacterium]|nr:DNRLRE domain-containing protein [bacterium]